MFSDFSGDELREEPERCGAERAQQTAWAALLATPAAFAARRYMRVYRKNPPPSPAEYVRLYGGRGANRAPDREQGTGQDVAPTRPDL